MIFRTITKACVRLHLDFILILIQVQVKLRSTSDRVESFLPSCLCYIHPNPVIDFHILRFLSLTRIIGWRGPDRWASPKPVLNEWAAKPSIWRSSMSNQSSFAPPGESTYDLWVERSNLNGVLLSAVGYGLNKILG
jgi:hypothetical protein